jgi:hypothetical protein
MEPVSLLIGVIAGGCVASAIWVIANIIIGNKGKAERTERNSVISSIGERIAETDSLLVSFSAGVTSGERVKGQILKNIEAIQSLYKPNLFLFDVFYTKYIDTLLIRYTEYVKNVTTIVKQPPVVVDHFAEAAAVAIEQPPVFVKEKVVAPAPVQAPAPAVTAKVTKESAEIASVAAIAPVAIEPVVEEEKEVNEILVSSTSEAAKAEFDARNVEFSIEPVTLEPVKTEHFEVLPVEDADIPEAQPEVQDITSIEDLQKEESEEIASASIPKEQEAEISFEAMAQDVMSVEDEMGATKIGFPSARSLNIETQPQYIHGLAPQNSDEEEFSMETIMDLDMSKIPAFSQEKSHITIKPQSTKPVEVDHPLQDTRKIYPPSVQAAAAASIKTPGVFAKQAAETNFKPSPAPAPVKNNLETSQTEPVVFDNHDQHQVEKDNYGITGDDVADQMDSFFGIGK